MPCKRRSIINSVGTELLSFYSRVTLPEAGRPDGSVGLAGSSVKLPIKPLGGSSSLAPGGNGRVVAEIVSEVMDSPFSWHRNEI